MRRTFQLVLGKGARSKINSTGLKFPKIERWHTGIITGDGVALRVNMLYLKRRSCRYLNDCNSEIETVGMILMIGVEEDIKQQKPIPQTPLKWRL